MPPRNSSYEHSAWAFGGLSFVDCNGLTVSSGATTGSAGQPAHRRREVVVNGRRAKVVDVHAHCIIPEAQALLGSQASESRTPRSTIGIESVGERRLSEMDEQGIDIEAISINPAWYGADRDGAEKATNLQNEKLAEYCAAYPDRFVAFASLALQFPDLAVTQLEHAVKQLGLRGAAVGGSVNGVEFSDESMHPVWAKAEELGVLIFIHPQSTPELSKRLSGNGWLANTIGNPLDTTIALSHLIFEGTLDKFPGLKICAAHGGGYLPSYAPRSDNSLRVSPDMDTGVVLKKKPTEYIRQMYYDTLVFTSEALRHLAAETGVSQLVLGTDHPIPWQSESVDHILNAEGFSDDDRIAMLGGNAMKLLGIKD